MGVIAKSDFLAARYAELIARDHDLTLLTDETDAYPGGIVVSSVRLAKGLEFDEAVLLDADGRQYATEADRNLLYVAVTRAMHALTVLYRDEPSPFLGENAAALGQARAAKRIGSIAPAPYLQALRGGTRRRRLRLGRRR